MTKAQFNEQIRLEVQALFKIPAAIVQAQNTRTNDRISDRREEHRYTEERRSA